MTVRQSTGVANGLGTDAVGSGALSQWGAEEFARAAATRGQGNLSEARSAVCSGLSEAEIGLIVCDDQTQRLHLLREELTRTRREREHWETEAGRVETSAEELCRQNVASCSYKFGNVDDTKSVLHRLERARHQAIERDPKTGDGLADFADSLGRLEQMLLFECRELELAEEGANAVSKHSRRRFS